MSNNKILPIIPAGTKFGVTEFHDADEYAPKHGHSNAGKRAMEVECTAISDLVENTDIPGFYKGDVTVYGDAGTRHFIGIKVKTTEDIKKDLALKA